MARKLLPFRGVTATVHGFSENMTFYTADDAFEFAREELDAWGSDFLGLQLSDWTTEILHQTRSTLQAIESDAHLLMIGEPKDAAKTEIYRRLAYHMNMFTERRIISARSPDGIFVCSIAKLDKPMAAAALSILTKGPWRDPQLQHLFNAALAISRNAMPAAQEKAEFAAIRSSWTKWTTTERAQHSQAAASLAHTLETATEIVTTAREQTAAWNETVTETAQKHERMMTAMRENYESLMSVQGPQRYWKDKAESNRTWAIVSFFLFCVLVAAGVSLVAIYGPALLAEVRGDHEQIGLGGALVLTLPALGFLYLLRLVSRLFTTNLQKMEDANERRTMVTTYLALLRRKTTPVKDEERIIMLNALFRPGPGEHAEESLPGLLEFFRAARS